MVYETVNWGFLHLVRVFLSVCIILWCFLKIFLLFFLCFLCPLLILIINRNLDLIFKYISYSFLRCLMKIASNVFFNTWKNIYLLLALGISHIPKRVETSDASTPITIDARINLVLASNQIVISNALFFPFTRLPPKQFICFGCHWRSLVVLACYINCFWNPNVLRFFLMRCLEYLVEVGLQILIQ